jgi:hypothetical protein
MPLILEAVRRHDEFQMAKALVPDDMKLGPAGVKPTRPEDEPDQELLRFVWARALSGVTPALCEADCRVDCYRVRRMYAHWLEEGALKQR